MKRQRISFTGNNGDHGQNLSISVANKGLFVVYTKDDARFTICTLEVSQQKCLLRAVKHWLEETYPRVSRSLLTSLETCHFCVSSLSRHQQTLKYVITSSMAENNIIIGLFEIAEDEFGLPSTGNGVCGL
ncbi:hypothetical protein LWI28_021669 [Acer negundo]|uniref:Uncharacterized protein n=1 Tax=Acer negundo TaxID=4023 RepID=A0AAD5JG33_ACENE|nr:hypothetical protein LWI28_021669 [Acer negundo]